MLKFPESTEEEDSFFRTVSFFFSFFLFFFLFSLFSAVVQNESFDSSFKTGNLSAFFP